MLKDIAETANNLGWNVSILTTSEGSDYEQSVRKEWSSATSIPILTLKLKNDRRRSIARKLVDGLYYGSWVVIQLATRRPKLVLVATTPPIMIAALVRLVGRVIGFQYIYHCQDIYPEAMALNGGMKKGLLYSVLRRIDKSNVDGARNVVVLSSDMADTLVRRGCSGENISVINNFIFSTGAVEAELPGRSRKETVRFLFSGTMGRMQNLELLMEAISHLKDEQDIEFHFMGDGVMRPWMENMKDELGLDNVNFLGQRPLAEAVFAMSQADFGIVSLAPEIVRVAYPSKTMMYLGNGLPVFGLVEPNTELGRFINGFELGRVIEPRSAEHVAAEIRDLAKQQRARPFDRACIAGVAQGHFGREVSLDKFSEIFAS